jgi:hypothetical protein
MNGEPIIVNIHKKNGVRPHFDVYIGRATAHTEFVKDSPWANPYRISQFQYPEDCLVAYENHIRLCLADEVHTHINIDDLTGKVLGCWCVNATTWDNPKCHGQILMKLWEEKHQEAYNWYRARCWGKCTYGFDNGLTCPADDCIVQDEYKELKKKHDG